MSGTYQRRQRIQGAGVVQTPFGTGNMGALQNGLDRAAAVFGGISSDIERREERTALYAADEEARTIAIRDEAGNYTVPQRDPLTAAGRTFNAGVAKRITDDVAIQGDSYFRTLRQSEAGQDPAAYAAAVDGYVRERVQRAPEWLRGEAEVQLRRRGSEYLGAVGDAAAGRERQLQAATSGQRLEMLNNDLLGLADADITSGPQFDAAAGGLRAHLADMVRTRQITPEGAEIQAQATMDRIAARPIARAAELVAQRDGVQAGREALEASLRDPQAAGLGERAMREARAEGTRRLALIEQGQQVQRSELAGTLRNVEASVRAGVSVAPDRLESYAANADRLGLRQQAAELRALGQVQNEAVSYRSMPLPELLRVGTEARATGAPEDPASAMRVKLLAGMVQDRVEALRNDPVGFAQSQPLVRAAMDRVAAGQGTQADVVRAQDAVLEGNGVDPVGHRIMPASEVRALKDAVQNAPITGDPATGQRGAADVLQQTFERYGPENRWRVWNDLRGAGLPAGLRPVALLMASPDQGNALRAYLEADRVGGEALSKAIGTDATKQVREEVATALQPLRGTSGGTGQDAALLADAGTATETLAMLYAANMTPREAARRAAREVVDGGLAIVENDLGKFRVPKGVDYDAPAFAAAMGKMLGRDGGAPIFDPATGAAMGETAGSGAMEGVRFRIPPGSVSAGLTDEQSQTAFRRSLQSFARFRPSPDGMGVRLQDDKGRPVFTEEGRPYELRFGQERAPGGPPAMIPAGPRGLRNNNPLNLEFRGQDGASIESHSSPRFARFGSMEDGVSAAAGQLLRYGERGLDTVAGIVNRWAPPSENDTPAYVSHVARALGVGANERINLRDPDTMSRLVASMAKKENGRDLDPEVVRRGVARRLA